MGSVLANANRVYSREILVIQLTPSQQDFVNTQVATGAFRNPSEVLQAALELLDSRQQEYAQLSEAIAQVQRGDVAELDVEDLKQRGRLRLESK
ncbi:ribbon-helix-helix domain-containing protein [Lacipirellula sp.]|uniref:ribbon-helix-helix domain-containing protein n=1 Tax=Lacipirellula sp. TaxID=2691419 RepID=UPI003D1207AA